MSFFVTRPPVPVPGTVDGSTPCSAAMRATTGDTNVLPFRLRRGSTGAGGAVAAAGGGLGERAGRRLGGARCGLGRRAGAARQDAAGASGVPRWRDLGAGGSDGREHGADLDGLALLDEDLVDDALGRARHLGVDLVGRDLEQRLVAADRLADLAKPLRDRPLGDGDAHLGHHDLGLRSCRHRSSSCQ